MSDLERLYALVQDGWARGERLRAMSSNVRRQPSGFPLTDAGLRSILFRQANPTRAAELLAGAAEANVSLFWKLINSPPAQQSAEFALAAALLGGEEAMDGILAQLDDE